MLEDRARVIVNRHQRGGVGVDRRPGVIVAPVRMDNIDGMSSHELDEIFTLESVQIARPVPTAPSAHTDCKAG